MTISATNAFSGPFAPNGVTTAFPFTFAVAAADELKVLIDDTEVSSGLYTVTLNDPDAAIHEGGTVTFAVAPTGSELLIQSDPSFDQDIAFTNSGPFLAESHDEANDRAAIRDIYLRQLVSDTFDAAIDLTGAISVLTRTALALLPSDQGTALLTEPGAEGPFVFYTAARFLAETGLSLVTEVAADPRRGRYVAPATDTTGASGAWVRIYTVLVPDWFRLPGDADDGPALAAASAVINAAGRGAMQLNPRTYWIGSQTLNGPAPPQGGGGVYTFAPNTPNPIEIDSCTGPVVVYGNGARIKCLPGKKFGAFNENGTARADTAPFLGAPGIAGFNIATPYAAMVWVHDCSGPVTVKGLELDGNIAAATIGGPWGDTGRQMPMTGVELTDNTGPLDIDVWSHHHGLDGGTGDGPGLLSTREQVTIRGRFANNGRQAFSHVGGNGWEFEDCYFGQTGRDIGSLAYSAPAAGVDIEPSGAGKYAVNTSFLNCVFSDNAGIGALSDTNAFVKYAHFKNCKFVGTTNGSVWPRNPGFVFEDCEIIGTFFNLYGSDNPFETTQFRRCLITDDVTRSPTGEVFGSAFSYILVSGTSDKAYFEDCHWLKTTAGGPSTNGNTGNLATGAGMKLHNCIIEEAAGASNLTVYGIYSGERTHFKHASAFPAGGVAPYAWAFGTGDALDSYLAEHSGQALALTRFPANIDKATGKKMFYGSATYDPPSLALAAQTTIQTMTVTGVVLGDKIDEVSFSIDLAGARLFAWVSAANTVSYYFINENGANPLDLASGTVRVKVVAA